MKHQEQCRAAGRDRVRRRRAGPGVREEKGCRKGWDFGAHIYLPWCILSSTWSLCSPMVQPGHSVGQGEPSFRLCSPKVWRLLQPEEVPVFKKEGQLDSSGKITPSGVCAHSLLSLLPLKEPSDTVGTLVGCPDLPLRVHWPPDHSRWLEGQGSGRITHLLQVGEGACQGK